MVDFLPSFTRETIFTTSFLHSSTITKTCLCNFDPLKPQLYSKTGIYRGIHYLFLFLLKNQGLTNPSFSHLPGIPQHLENGSELQYSLYILYIFLGKRNKKITCPAKIWTCPGQLGNEFVRPWFKNIDCGYSLEPPRRGGFNEYLQSMFLSRKMKIIRDFI